MSTYKSFFPFWSLDELGHRWLNARHLSIPRKKRAVIRNYYYRIRYIIRRNMFLDKLMYHLGKGHNFKETIRRMEWLSKVRNVWERWTRERERVQFSKKKKKVSFMQESFGWNKWWVEGMLTDVICVTVIIIDVGWQKIIHTRCYSWEREKILDTLNPFD